MSGIFAGLLAGGGASGDASWSYVSMLLSTTSLSNANNNLFADSSGAFNPISRTGNTTQGSFTPYGSLWSNFFDGSGDYLTAPDNAALQLGSSDFTVEFWVNFSVVPGALQGATLVSKFNTSNTGYEVILYNNTMYFQAQTANIGMTYAFTPTAGLWYHIAWTRSGANSYGFINGVLVASTSAASGSITNLAQALQIGRRGDNTFYLNGYMSNVRVVKGTAVYTAAFTPPTAPLTAITNTSLLTCQSNGFRDASTNNFTISAFGNTSVQKFSPFPSASPGISYNQSDITNWSGYFDGSGDYLQTPSNAAFALGTGDYTVECWIYATSTPSDMGIYEGRSTGSSSNGFTLTAFSSSVIRIFAGGVLVASSGTSYVGQWTHVAVTRASGTTTLWINGVSQGTSATSYNCTNTDAVVGGGRYSAGSSVNTYFPGYISNARIVKGTAVYTSAFTPPTTNLTAISGTSLLTCQNAAFTDNSTNNFVVTINGNTTVTGNSPFNTVGYWSNYFDGTGDYLETPSSSAAGLTGDWTVEAWVYPTSFASVGALFDCRSGGTGFAIYYNLTGFSGGAGAIGYATNSALVANSSAVINLNTWNHIAVVRSANTVTGYANGSSVFTYTETRTNATTTTYQIGIPSAIPFGYFSNFRVVRGTAIYSGSTITVPTAPLTAITNTSLLTCQNGRFIDNSTNAFAITVNGNTSVQSFDPFYTATIASNGGSMYFDGTGDYLTVPYAANMRYSGDFTIECWVNPTARLRLYPCIVSNYSTYTSNGGFAIFAGHNSSSATKYQVSFNGAFPFIQSTSDIVYGAWAHIALVRVGSTITLYINGVANGTGTSSAIVVGTANSWWVGTTGDSLTDGAFNGYINGLRATPSAVYTAAFTPPTAPLTPSANTTLLLNGMNAGAYDATAINDMETVGNAQVSTVQSKFGGSSFYVPTGCLFIPNSQPLVLGSGNWTVEFWAYTDASGTKVYFDSLNAANTVLQMEIYSSGTSISWVTVGSGVPNITGTGALTANTWQHIAACKSGSSTRLFVNGTQVGSTYTDTATYDTARWEIGSRLSGSFPIVGYLDDLRITKGVARYTANFTAPTAAFPTF